MKGRMSGFFDKVGAYMENDKRVDNLKEQIEAVREELLSMSEQDCYEEYQFGFREGLWKAYEMLGKVINK